MQKPQQPLHKHFCLHRKSKTQPRCMVFPSETSFKMEARRSLYGRPSNPKSSSAMILSYDLFDGTVPDTPLVFLHGLFGSKSNFQSIAKVLVQKTGRKVLTMDARNHGNSPHSPEMTYEAMSADVQRLLHQLHFSTCILIGHSMGGKTAMTIALQKPDLVERLICVDISPVPITGHSKFPTYISSMNNIHLEDQLPRSMARRLAEEQLQPVVQDAAVRQFLLTNLVKKNGQYCWRLNLEAISHHLPDIMSFPEFQSTYPGPALFLGGADSCYISSEDYSEIERLFPKAEIQYILDAGHWVHADQTQEFIAAICRFLLTS
uniref:sn-1-specific diacylglycerol lipase ABHD11 n=3 Tax=Geotrypetes seraphini TaxID=260995 RepID=A0A6P8NPF1_GEOSA|nr:protein ABHD11 isoform X1 [Geotrypetes seraphini]